MAVFALGTRIHYYRDHPEAFQRKRSDAQAAAIDTQF